MLRVVLAVAVAAGLLAASLPAIDDARVEAADERVAGELSRLTDLARTVLRREPALSPGSPGARRVVRLVLPRAGPWSAGVRNLTIRSVTDGVTPGPGRYAWTVRGGTRRERRVAGPRYVVDGPGRSTRIVLRGSGPHRLAVSPVRTSDGPAIRVRRADV